MNFLRLAPAAIVTGLLVIGLAACSSGDDNASHSGHEPAASGGTSEHADHAGDSADTAEHMGGEHMGGEMKRIEPSADYPLATCVVSGEALGGDMGPAIAYEYQGQEVQLCCKGCVDEFKESPATFLSKVQAASTEK